MTENMKTLLQIVSGNKELSAKIGGMGKEDIIALARELGVELTEADFVQNCELAADELDTVVGGRKAGEGEKTCDCVMGGGGEYSSGDVRCVCISG